MPYTPISGDLVFCHSKGIISRAIRLGELIRWRSGATWNHVAIIDSVDGNSATVIQAEAHGVTNDKQLSSVSPGGHYLVVSPPDGIDRNRLLAFARQEVGASYGFISIASLVINILSPGWISFRWTNSWICSAISAESLRAGGWLHRWSDVDQVTPAQLAEAIGVPV